MISRSLSVFCLAGSVVAAAVMFTGASAARAQTGAIPGGSVSGTVTATNAKGETIAAPNVLVQIWGTDAATEAKRDSACATWLANKTVWMQAKGEFESPSGVNWDGTAVGHDLNLISSLMAFRRDTVRTDASGAFLFTNVPAGAYTLEAEVFANNKFLQWSKDVAVLPKQMLSTTLDKATLAENQYCPMTSTTPAAGPKSRKP